MSEPIAFNPVIFLDFDGPVIPLRAHFLRGNTGFDRKLFDPIAVSMIENVAQEADARYVISSSWRIDGRDRICEILMSNGIDTDRLHRDWKTPPRATRYDEVMAWVDAHPEVVNWAAIDDDPSMRTCQNAVYVSLENGLLYEHLKTLRGLLGVKHTPLLLELAAMEPDEDTDFIIDEYS